MHRDVHFDSDSHAIVMRLPLSEGPAPDRVIVDDTHFLFTAHFKKSGADLILADDSGKKLVLVDYFNLEKAPGPGLAGWRDLVGRCGGTACRAGCAWPVRAVRSSGRLPGDRPHRTNERKRNRSARERRR
jgi:hypothetical protein